MALLKEPADRSSDREAPQAPRSSDREAPQAPRSSDREAPQAPRSSDREAPQATWSSDREAPQAPRLVDEQALAAHLARAGEHLRADRLDDATDEIKDALDLNPGDLRTRNLLGLLHFRAGRFDEALKVYRELLKERESDTALRLNLGLVELRMGHYGEAVEHLGKVVECEPDNTRAQGYYGLALMRAGDLSRARLILKRAGQDELVRQVDKMMAGQASSEPAFAGTGAPRMPGVSGARGTVIRGPSAEMPMIRGPSAEMSAIVADPPRENAANLPTLPRPLRVARAATPPLPPSVAEGDVGLDQEGRQVIAEARQAADAGGHALEAEQPFSPAGPSEATTMMTGTDKGDQDWLMRPASQGLPPPNPSSKSPLRPIPIPVPKERTLAAMAMGQVTQQAQPLSAFVRGHELGPAVDGSAFSITGDGLLVVRVTGPLPTRSIGVVVSTGELTFDPLSRRARGRNLNEPFGEGAFGLFRASGQGMMVISPRGGHFVALALQDESLYLRESVTFAFEDGLHWENGRLPGAGPAPNYGYAGLPDALSRVVQFRGTGQLVLRTDRPLFTVRLGAGQTGFIEVEHLIGWMGRIIPSLLMEEGGVPTPYVECSGEGYLLIEPPPKDGSVAAPAVGAGDLVIPGGMASGAPGEGKGP